MRSQKQPKQVHQTGKTLGNRRGVIRGNVDIALDAGPARALLNHWAPSASQPGRGASAASSSSSAAAWRSR
eukprot:6336966-Pyramimonas_sp.AAC.1